MKKPTIGINTLFMIPNAVGGTEYYLRSALSELERLDHTNSYVVFCNEENFNTFVFTNPRWKKVYCPIRATCRPLRILFEQFVLPFLVMIHKCTVFHSFGYFGPIISFVKHIITVYDVNWRDCPEDVSFIEKLVLKFFIESNVRTASAIITISDFSKKRLLHYFPSIQDKVYIVLPALSNGFIKESKKKHVYPLGEAHYLLCVSGLYPHKRIPYLLDIWEKIAKDDKKLFLVLIGKNGKDSQLVQDRIMNLPRTKYYPKVTLPALVAFYQHAKACIFPSLYEGFGLPILEAFACGCPVVLSDIPVFKEIAQHAGTFFNPYDNSSMQDAVRSVLYTNTVRKNQIKKGFSRSSDFSRIKSGSTLYHLYRQICTR